MMKKSTLVDSVKKLYFFLITGSIFFLFFGVPVQVQAVSDEDCKIADTALKQAADLRGLRVKKRVPCKVHDKDKVKEYLLHAINEKIPPKKLKHEEIVYKALGFFKEDFDYKKGLVDLYLGQIGGYYDPEKKHYVMAKWLPAMMQPTIAVHELTHALQDQYYNLEPFMDPKKHSSDTLFAHSALVEGDASAVMYDYNRELMNQGPLSEDDNVDSLIAQSLMSVAMTNSSQGAPEGMLMLLVFPYTSGLRFTHALLQKGGYKEVDKAYKRPPQSTEEILHPEKYFSGKQDYKIFSKEDLFKDSSVEFSDSLGEFFITVWLRTLGVSSARASDVGSGWGGDLVAITPNGSDACKVLWRTAWDSDADAKEFMEAAKEAFDIDSRENSVEKSLSSKRSITLSYQESQVDVLIDYKENCS